MPGKVKVTLIAKRITLSEECLEMLDHFKKAGSFRSRSQTIEEIVRRVYYIKQDGTLMAANVLFERLGFSINGAKTK